MRGWPAANESRRQLCGILRWNSGASMTAQDALRAVVARLDLLPISPLDGFPAAA